MTAWLPATPGPAPVAAAPPSASLAQRRCASAGALRRTLAPAPAANATTPVRGGGLGARVPPEEFRSALLAKRGVDNASIQYSNCSKDHGLCNEESVNFTIDSQGCQAELQKVAHSQRVLEEALVRIIMGCDAMTLRLDRLEAAQNTGGEAQAKSAADLEKQFDARINCVNERIHSITSALRNMVGVAHNQGVENTVTDIAQERFKSMEGLLSQTEILLQRTANEQAEAVDALRVKQENDVHALWEAMPQASPARQWTGAAAQPQPQLRPATTAALPQAAPLTWPHHASVPASPSQPAGLGQCPMTPASCASTMATEGDASPGVRLGTYGSPAVAQAAAAAQGSHLRPVAQPLAVAGAKTQRAQAGLPPPVGLVVDPTSLGPVILQKSQAFLGANKAVPQTLPLPTGWAPGGATSPADFVSPPGSPMVVASGPLSSPAVLAGSEDCFSSADLNQDGVLSRKEFYFAFGLGGAQQLSSQLATATGGPAATHT